MKLPLKIKFLLLQATTPSSMLFDDKSRKIPQSTIINKPSTKQTTTKPKQRTDIVEPEIDIENVPILQGSFEVTKTDADITQKKVRTSTLKPFTITNGSVRMKPKKTTIEKVHPLPKVPENLTANILKLENVTKAFHYERVTTNKPTTTTEEMPITSTEAAIQSSSTASSTMVTKIYASSMPAFNPSKDIVNESFKVVASTETIPSIIMPSEPPPNKPIVEDLSQLEKEVIEKRPASISFPSTIILDDQPWQPIQPSMNQMNYTSDSKKKVQSAVSPSIMNTNFNDDSIGFKLLPRNKPQTNAIKTNRPPVYQSYNNPALMYGPQEVERLGNGFIKPYPIPIDLIGDQTNTKIDDLILNKGEVLASDKQAKTTTMKTPIIEITPVILDIDEDENGELKLNTDEVIEQSTNKTEIIKEDKVTGAAVGEILLDLLKESNVNLNESKPKENNDEVLVMQSRHDEFELPQQKSSNSNIDADNVEPVQETDHTEAIDALATVISSMETLSFKNIKDYIMATTKAFSQEVISTSTEHEQTTPRREKPQIDSMVKSDRISLVAPTSAPNMQTAGNLQKTSETMAKITTTTPFSMSSDDSENEPATASYVEVETVQYTPGTSWHPSLFPVQSKWEYVNGSIVYPSKAPMRKVFNETLQAWIIENQIETTERFPSIDLVRNTSEPLKNISAIFDTLASKLGINPKVSTKLPPFTPHFAANKNRNEQSSTPPTNLLASTPPFKRLPPTPATLPSSSSSHAATVEGELPVLLNQQTESYYPTSAETSFGQAEVEEVDPTQYEQMLLIDRVSAALRPSSTAPSLVTLMPVKSNSGLRPGTVINEKIKSNARGFPPSAASTSFNNRRFEDTSFVIRTNINVSS